MAELPVNVIIIAILVVLVLVIVAAFFTGGFSQIIERIKGATAGLSFDDARLQCETLCSNYQEVQTERAKRIFCEKTLDVDLNANGKLEEDEKDLPCEELGVDCGLDCSPYR